MIKKSAYVLASLVVLFGISTSFAYAHYPNVTLGSTFSVCTMAGDQKEPRLAFDGSRFLVIWSEFVSLSNTDIYGQLINTDGALHGSRITISNLAGSQQFIERLSGCNVAFNSASGRYLVVWQDNRNGSSDIYGQLINADGTHYGGNFPISPLPPVEHYGGCPTVCADAIHGRFLVAWRGYGNPASIFARSVNADGTLGESYFQVNEENDDYYADNPRIVFDSINDRFLITWRETGSGQSYGRIVTHDGSPYSSERLLESGWPTALVYDPEKIKYAAFGVGGPDATQGLLINASSANVESNFPVFDNYGGFCAAAVDTNRKKCLVVDYKAGIIGRFLNRDGTLYGDAFDLLPQSQYGPCPPFVAFASDSVGSLVVWADKSGSTGYDIFGKFVKLSDPQTLAETKKQADGARVIVDGALVTAAFPGFFYMQSEDRVSGIRVQKSDHGLNVGDKVEVAGILGTNADDERCIDADWTDRNGTGTTRPLGMPNKSLGGAGSFYNQITGAGQRGITGAFGLNNMGLLVRVWGTVIDVDTASPITWFKIDDGSGEDVTVEIPADAIVTVAGGNFVRVDGVSSCRKSGDNLYRLLRLRSVDDVGVLIIY